MRDVILKEPLFFLFFIPELITTRNLRFRTKERRKGPAGRVKTGWEEVTVTDVPMTISIEATDDKVASGDKDNNNSNGNSNSNTKNEIHNNNNNMHDNNNMKNNINNMHNNNNMNSNNSNVNNNTIIFSLIFIS